MNKANPVVDTKAILGEGPVWDWKFNQLFWVDIEGCKLHSHTPLNGRTTEWVFDEMIAAAIPTESGELLMAMESGLAYFDLKTTQLTRLGVLENENPELRFNDGKVDPKGHFLVGTMHKEAASNAGNLYHVTTQLHASVLHANTSISNGMAWTDTGKKFYYIDSPSFEVKVFDYDMKNSALANGKTAFRIPKHYGAPDGMSIDDEGMLWIAHWGGSCVRKWNPMSGKVLRKIDVPAPHVTSCCFGGEDLKTLYITTARSGLSKMQQTDFPYSGALFSCSVDVKGTPINYFNNNE